ncbi:S41 family peptidase [bacterium]|nr:S41 family peptidase [bacterium]
MRRKYIYPAVLAVLLALAAVVLATQGGGSNVIKDVKLIARVINETYENYVDPIDMHKFVVGGIKGLLDGLDYHTVYFEPKDYDELKTSTHGEFGGLGIVIGIRDNILTIISPMEGTPAYRMGLAAGDKIVGIDGKPTKGMTTKDAVDVLRGDPGTKVTLTIVRFGEPEPLDYEITRDIIHIDAVPFAGMIDDKIGYIRLARFSEDAGSEVKAAVDSLEREGMTSLIFDLRSNPGGLLSQAVEVASVFLEENDMVVYTKGKTEQSRRDYRARWGSEYNSGELVVLVNGGSASASEIVSGAIQDHDRGVILGTKTFGKGLVQSVIQLSGDGDALKITTAKYYIPSERCIQKDAYLYRPESVILRPDTVDKDTAETSVEDLSGRWWEHTFKADEGNSPSDSITADTPVYYTDSGRPVYGGGGITPDVFFEPEKVSRLAIELERRSMFFDFAVDRSISPQDYPPDFSVSDQLFHDFVEYTQDKDFEYKTLVEVRLEEAESAAVAMGYTSGVEKQFDDLRESIESEKKKDFERNRDYIDRAIRREFVSKLWGEDANYQYVVLKTDPTIAKAVEIINHEDEYAALLRPPEDK